MKQTLLDMFKRLYKSISSVLYLLVVVSTYFWWFLPYLISGKSHEYILDKWFNHIETI